jgi:plastocyanin
VGYAQQPSVLTSNLAESPLGRGRTILRILRIACPALLVAALVAGVHGTVPALAASTSSVDCGSSSLQAAIDAAGSGDTLLVSGTCEGSFFISKSLTLQGDPTAALNGGRAGRVLMIDAGVTVSIDGLTIASGWVDDPGGGIYNSGTLTLAHSTLTGNHAEGHGGGLYNDGNATVVASTVAGNTSRDGGGGVFNVDTMAVVNSTLTANGTTEGANGGGIENAGALQVTSSTVSGNSSSRNGAGIWAYGWGGTTKITTTLLAGNTPAASGANCYGPVSSGGYNLVGYADDGCTFAAKTTDQVGTTQAPIEPDVAPLADSGGATETMALFSFSAAVDRVPLWKCTGTLGASPVDQRGVSRPVGTRCDIGPYEGSIPPDADLMVGRSVPDSVIANTNLTYDIDVSNAGPARSIGAVLTITPPKRAIFGSATPSVGSCTGTSRLTCSFGGMHAGDDVKVGLLVTPICPGPVGDAESVTGDGPDPDTSNNTASGYVNVASQSNTSYVTVTDKGLDPQSLQVPQGRSVQWCFFGTRSHHIVDSTGMNLFDSGTENPVSYYRFRFVAAGTYPYIDSQTTNSGTVAVPVKVSPKTGLLGFTYTITWASIQAPSGYAYDVQIKRPGSASFVAWKTGTNLDTGKFNPSSGPGTYSFRAHLRKISNGKTSGWSPAGVITVTGS